MGLIDELRIMSDKFEFDHPGNVVYCECEFSPIQHRLTLSTVEEFVQTSPDTYAFIAVTASSSTLDGLFRIVQSEKPAPAAING